MADEKIKINFNGAMIEIDKEQFSQASEKGELIITSDDHIIRTKDEQKKYEDNLTGERYKAGKEKAEKDAVNAVADELGITLDETKKTVKNLIAIYAEKIKTDAKIEPSKKITELEERSVKALNLAKEWEGKYTDLDNKYNGALKQQRIDNIVISSFPVSENGERIKTKIPAGDISLLFKNKYKIDFDDEGNEFVEIDGKKLQDKNLDNLKVKDVFGEFVKPYMDNSTGGGKGKEGGDKTGISTPGSLESFTNEMEEKGIKVSSIDYNEEMEKRIKDGTLKV